MNEFIVRRGNRDFFTIGFKMIGNQNFRIHIGLKIIQYT